MFIEFLKKIKQLSRVGVVIVTFSLLIIFFQNFGTTNEQNCSSYFDDGLNDVTPWSFVNSLTFKATVADELPADDSLRLLNGMFLTRDNEVILLGHGNRGLISPSAPSPSPTPNPDERRFFYYNASINKGVLNLLTPAYVLGMKVDYNGNVYATTAAENSIDWVTYVLFKNRLDDGWYRSRSLDMPGSANKIRPHSFTGIEVVKFAPSRDGDLYQAVNSAPSSDANTGKFISIFRRNNKTGVWKHLDTRTHEDSGGINGAITSWAFLRDKNNRLYVFGNRGSTRTAFGSVILNPTSTSTSSVTLTSYEAAANGKKFELLDSYYDENRDEIYLAGRTFNTSVITSLAVYRGKNLSNPQNAIWELFETRLVSGQSARAYKIGVESKNGDSKKLYVWGEGFTPTEKRNLLYSFDLKSTSAQWATPSHWVLVASAGGSVGSKGFFDSSVSMDGDIFVRGQGVVFKSHVAERLNPGVSANGMANLISGMNVVDRNGNVYVVTKESDGQNLPRFTAVVKKLTCQGGIPNTQWPNVIQPVGTPETPVLTIMSRGDRKVVLRFSLATKNLSSGEREGSFYYKLQRSDSFEGPYADLLFPGSDGSVHYDFRSTNSNDTFKEYTDILNGLVNGEDYFYRAYAVGPDGLTSNFSDIKSETPVLEKPAAPGGFNAVGSNTAVSVSWNQPTTPVLSSGYQFFYKLYSSTNQVDLNPLSESLKVYQGLSPSFVHQGLINGTTYFYRVMATVRDSANGNILIEGDPSNIISATPSPPAPTPTPRPQNLLATADNAKVTLQWTLQNPTFHFGFDILRKLPNDSIFSVVAAPTPGTVTSFQDTSGLVNGQRYTYKVRAKTENISCESDPIKCSTSDPIDAIPHIPLTSLSAVENFNGTLHVILNWSVCPQALSYIVKRKKSSETSFTTIASNVMVNTFDDFGGLENGQVYDYLVQGVLPDGLLTKDIQVTNVIPQSPVIGLRAISGNNFVELQWDAHPLTESYRVYRRQGSIGPFNQISPQNLTLQFFRDNTAVNNTLYEYYVVSVIRNKQSPESQVVQAMPEPPQPIQGGCVVIDADTQQPMPGYFSSDIGAVYIKHVLPSDGDLQSIISKCQNDHYGPMHSQFCASHLVGSRTKRCALNYFEDGSITNQHCESEQLVCAQSQSLFSVGNNNPQGNERILGKQKPNQLGTGYGCAMVSDVNKNGRGGSGSAPLLIAPLMLLWFLRRRSMKGVL